MSRRPHRLRLAATLLGTALLATACTPVPGARRADVSWATIGGVLVPLSAKDGPRTVAGLRASGYSATPRGAAFAAANLLLRSNTALGPQGYRQTILAGFVPGRDQSRLLERTDQEYVASHENGSNGQDVGTGTAMATITGYSVLSFAPSRARVAVDFTGVGLAGTLMAYDVVLGLVYRDGTWLAVPPRDGDWANAFHLLSSGDRTVKFV